MGDLEKAKTALANEDRVGALEALLSAWRACRAPELEALIELVSKDAARASQPLPEDRSYDAAWTAREKSRNLGELEHLLPGLWSDPRGSIPLRLRKLLDWGAHPRLGAALLTMIEEPPVTASSNFSMWTVLFTALPELVDSRAKKTLQARAKKKGGDSKFWPKLNGWIATALPKLAEPAQLSSAQSKLVAQLSTQAAALAKGKAPEAATTAAPKKAGTVAVLKTLEQAVDAKPAAMLEALRVVWEATRDADVATRVENLGHTLSLQQPALSGKPAELHAAWMKLAKAGAAENVTRLIEALVEGKLADTEERMAAMLEWAPDPRVGPKMVLLIKSSIGARPVLWKLCYELLVHHADPRTRAEIEKRVKYLETAALFDRNRAEGPHARRAHEPFLAACDRVRALSASEQAQLKKIAERIQGLGAKAAPSASDEEPLVRAIAEDYEANPPRLVYADFLSERADPRGEYISLAIAGGLPGAKLKGKIEASFKANQKALLGPLGPLKGFAMTFERGLLHTFEVKAEKVDWSDGPALDTLLSDLRWGVIHTLKFWGYGRKERGLEKILDRAPLFSLRRFEGATIGDVHAIARRDFPWKLQSVSINRLEPNDGKGWLEARALPALKELEVNAFELPHGDFFKSPLLRPLELLRVGAYNHGGAVDLAGWLGHGTQLAVKQLELRSAVIGFTATTTAKDGVRDLQFTVDQRGRIADQGFKAALASLRSIQKKDVGSVRWTSEAHEQVNAEVEQALSHLDAVRG